MHKKLYTIGNYVAELVIPDETKDLSCSLPNNIDVYDKNGKHLWNITKLLSAYSNERGLKYYEELYFDIKAIDHDKMFCIGLINHCEIDLINEKILTLVNNR
jgi:hypothetical protein